MTDLPLTDQALDQALAFTRPDGDLSVSIDGVFSNGPSGRPPETGAPFGGLMAALAARAMRQGLELEAPLRTLTVQFMAAARFNQPVLFRPALTRGGRNVAYTSLQAVQRPRETTERPILAALATWGRDADSPALAALTAPPPARDSLDRSRQLHGPFAPWFTRHVEYVFETGPHIMGGNEGRPAVERLWMRTKDGAPLDHDRLCFLLDAIYPPAFTAYKRPPMMTSVDLRYDILRDPTPELCPDGWAFFEFRMHDIGLGWSVDDCTGWAADGTPLVVARQRRKLL